MKSSVVTALIIVGVLGTSTAAMAMNTDTLSGIDAGTIGKAIEVLVPVVSDAVPVTPGSGAPTSMTSPTPSPVPSLVAPGNVTSAPTSAPVATGGGDPRSSQDSNSTSESDPAPSNSPEPSESESKHDD